MSSIPLEFYDIAMLYGGWRWKISPFYKVYEFETETGFSQIYRELLISRLTWVDH
jgi:hypothetical protein